MNTTIPSSAFRLIQGRPRRFTGIADSGRTLHRYFCGACGSPIYSQRANNTEYVVLRVGTLDGAPDMKITMNIWTKSKRPWAWIDPSTKQVSGQPDAPATK